MERTNAAPRRALPVSLWLVGAFCLTYGWLNAVEGAWTQVQLGLGGLAFGAVGLVLAVRSRVAMGWLFLGAQVLMGLSLGFPDLTFGLLVLLAAILLLFPSGRLPSRRWLVASIALGAATAVWLAVDVLSIFESENLSWAVYFVTSTAVLASSAVRLVGDYRKSVGQTRQQLKWLAWVLSIGGGLLLLSMIQVPPLQSANQLAGVLLLVGGPIAIGLAVTRHRLYDIDRIISRTVSYTLLVALLAGVVAGVATLIGTRFDSPLIVAATTLGVAAAFNPLRARTQKWVDRRFNRSRYDHEKVAEQFTSSLQDGIDVEGLVTGWLDVVTETMQPREIGVWTRVS
ncbi:MAG: hypothetical protein PVF87_06270 [Acidimicrobiia bacterium]|jgi:hypothetical protein